MVLGELGLVRLVLPEAAVAEVRRNLAAKLPDGSKGGQNLDQVTRRIATGQTRSRRVIAVDSARWCPMLSSPK
jgi:hypothetical protein